MGGGGPSSGPNMTCASGGGPISGMLPGGEVRDGSSRLPTEGAMPAISHHCQGLVPSTLFLLDKIVDSDTTNLKDLVDEITY